MEIIWDYAERMTPKFAYKVKAEYYGGRYSLSVEGIQIELFSCTETHQCNSNIDKYSKLCHKFLKLHFTPFYLMTTINNMQQLKNLNHSYRILINHAAVKTLAHCGKQHISAVKNKYVALLCF